MSNINLFSQIISKIDRNSFKKLVQEKQTDKYQKGCNSWTYLAGFRQTKFKIKSKIFLPDSTTIRLCLRLFDWAKYKTHKGAVKLHTLLDYDGNLPACVNVTDGKTADNKGACDIPLLSNSVIVADRCYNDFSPLNVWDSNKVFFVIRHKDNIQFESVKKHDLPEDRHQHILKDELIQLTGNQTKKKYPERLRRIAIWDEQHQQTIELITNQMSRTANTVSELSNLVAFLRWNLFVKIDLHRWLDSPFEHPPNHRKNQTQGVLFH